MPTRLDAKFFTGFTTDEIRTICGCLNNFLRSDQENFDFPDYGGIPEELSSRLMSDQVDKIQDAVQSESQFTLESVALMLAPY